MPNNNPQVLPAGADQVGGCLFVRVPWARADRFQSLFKARGIGSTLHLDPRAGEARLELWTNLSADRVRDLLEQPEPPGRL
jgi:hypothetical protein